MVWLIVCRGADLSANSAGGARLAVPTQEQSHDAPASAGLDNLAVGFSPRTGDAWVDTQLGDINMLARGNTDGFVDDVVLNFGAPRYLVRDYVENKRLPPGDVYYGCALAYQSRQPCANVLRDYEQNRGQGWGVIAQRMGIKPGSPAFHALKGNVGKSHGRLKGNARTGGSEAGAGKGHDDAGAPGNSGKAGKGKGGSEEHGSSTAPGNSGNAGNSGKGKSKKGGGH
jgi:hypothetical protein